MKIEQALLVKAVEELRNSVDELISATNKMREGLGEQTKTMSVALEGLTKVIDKFKESN